MQSAELRRAGRWLRGEQGPKRDVRVSAGREQHLRSLQPLSMEICNSLFLGDYLTSEGQAAEADLEMIRDAGFTVLGADPQDAHHRDPVIRRRGAGTALAPNA